MAGPIDSFIILLNLLALSAISFLLACSAVSRLLWIALSWLYHWLFTGLKGQTPGKMAMGIRVVDAQGWVPGLGIAALREFVGKFVSGTVLAIGLLWIALDSRKQGWHDKIAGTYVI